MFSHEYESRVTYTEVRDITPENPKRPKRSASTPKNTQRTDKAQNSVINEENEALKKELAKTKNELQGTVGTLQSLNAEYANYRNRTERDRDVSRATTVQSTIKALLPVMDDIDAARKHDGIEEGTPIHSILAKFERTLGQLGLEQISEAGVAFDPNIHEAVIVQPHAEIPVDHVSQVFRNGYIVGETVVRAAQVMVSSGAE